MNAKPVEGAFSSIQWQTVFDGVRELVCLLDTDFKVLTINKATEAFLGKTAKDVIGMHCWELFHADGQPHLHCPACKLSPIHNRTEMTFKEQQNWFNVTLDPFYTPQGVLGGALHIIRDVTKQKTRELELIAHSEELLKSNEAKESFLAVVAHDLRSPFHVLLNLSNILFSEDNILTTEERIRFTRMLHFEIRRVYSLLEDLLLWGNLQRGITNFEPADGDIKECILNAIFALSTAAKEKEITLIYSNVLSINAHFDENMISSAVRNILSNAIKFTPKSGTITISAEIIGEETCITVADTGLGMNKEVIQRLMSGEHVTPETGTEKEKGSGIGLKLCYEFVKQHGGRISVQSEKGKGSTFQIFLPC